VPGLCGAVVALSYLGAMALGFAPACVWCLAVLYRASRDNRAFTNRTIQIEVRAARPALLKRRRYAIWGDDIMSA
jgi:hypothetical protein